jgi:hypothetical protein
MCHAVIEYGRAERQRWRWIEPGRCELDVLQPRRLDYALGWAKPLFNASEHKGLFGQRQTLAFPAPSEML